MRKKINLIYLLFLFSSNISAKPLTLILDWLVNPDHAAILVAQEQDFLKARG